MGKIFQKKKGNFEKMKNTIGEILENFLDYCTDNKKFRILTDYHLNILFLDEVPIFEKIKWKLGYFYLDTCFYIFATHLIQDKVFLLFLLKLLFLHNNERSIQLISRKCFSESSYKRRFSVQIILARLTRGMKYYEFCTSLCSRFKSLAKYSLGIGLMKKKNLLMLKDNC